MIVDAAEVIAFALMEPDAARCAAPLSSPGRERRSVENYREAAARLDGGSGRPTFDVDAFPDAAGIELADATPDISRVARRQLGKGRHPAGLNLGDSIFHARAKVSGAPRLFSGAAFTATDVEASP